MLIAHLPAGFLLTRRILDHARPDVKLSRRLLVLGLIASVLPDLDLLHFYLIDQRQTLHRLYWPHLPMFWLAPAAVCFLVCALSRSKLLTLVFLTFYANVFLHLVLDTVAGPVFWLYPFDKTGLVLIDLPARYGWWIWNVVLHWTFGLELMICLAGLAAYLRSRRPRRTTLAAVNR